MRPRRSSRPPPLSSPLYATLLAALTLAVLLPSLASAQIRTFNLSYSGAQFGNQASALGSVTFDLGVLPNGPTNLANVSKATLGLLDWTLTVSGATTGNGVFTLADLETVPGQQNGWIWILSAPLDLDAELVGQAGFNDFNWCAGSNSCGNPGAPGGAAAFIIQTAGETGDRLRLTSMVANVPEPATGLLLLVGLTGVAASAVRRRPQGA